MTRRNAGGLYFLFAFLAFQFFVSKIEDVPLAEAVPTPCGKHHDVYHALCTDCNKDIKPEPAFRFTINTKPRATCGHPDAQFTGVCIECAAGAGSADGSLLNPVICGKHLFPKDPITGCIGCNDEKNGKALGEMCKEHKGTSRSICACIYKKEKKSGSKDCVVM